MKIETMTKLKLISNDDEKEEERKVKDLLETNIQRGYVWKRKH